MSALSPQPAPQPATGDTLVGTLRSNYDKDFAPGSRSNMRLDTLRHKKGGSHTKAVKGK